MTNSIHSIPLEKLIAHPENPNRMSRTNFLKLARNIEQTGLYEPLIVRHAPEDHDNFQIINGHHRRKALAKLGYQTADCVVWDVDDKQTDILLVTLNRLSGSDILAKKLVLLKKLNEKFDNSQLAKLLPQTARQLEHLVNLKMPDQPMRINTALFASPMVFFVNDQQRQQIEEAASLAIEPDPKKTKAEKNAAALTEIAKYFVNNSDNN